jgi:hypothetical protein
MRWYMRTCTGRSDDYLLCVAIHELVHILLNPLDSLFASLPDAENEHMALVHSQHNEFATESVARAICVAAGIDYSAKEPDDE